MPGEAKGTPVPGSGPGQGTQTPPTQQTPSQQGQPTNPPAAPAAPGTGIPESEIRKMREINNAQEALLREMNADRQKLHREIQELREGIKKSTTPSVSPDERAKQFYADPIGVLEERDKSIVELFKQELQATIAPILNATQRTEAQSMQSKLKDALKQDYGADTFTKMEPIVDDFFNRATASGVPLSPDLAELAGNTAFGMLARRGEVRIAGSPPPAAAATPPAGVPPSMTPPHMPPSAPMIPGHEPPADAALRKLTENEERLRRERGMTHKQFLDWIDVRPEDVIRTKIGREGGN